MLSITGNTVSLNALSITGEHGLHILSVLKGILTYKSITLNLNQSVYRALTLINVPTLNISVSKWKERIKYNKPELLRSLRHMLLVNLLHH